MKLYICISCQIDNTRKLNSLFPLWMHKCCCVVHCARCCRLKSSLQGSLLNTVPLIPFSHSVLIANECQKQNQFDYFVLN